MSNCPFCNLDPAANAAEPKRSTGLLRRAWRSIQWLFPTAVLALIPKCPFCVMAYVALFTGAGISVSAARWIQVLSIVLCLGAFVYLTLRYFRRQIWATRRETSAVLKK